MAFASTEATPIIREAERSTAATPIIREDRRVSTAATSIIRTDDVVPRSLQPVSFRGGTFSRGVDRGIQQTQGLIGQFLKSIGDETGFAGLVDVGDELVQEAFIEAVTNPARIESFDDVDSLSKAGEFVLQTLGEQVFNIAAAVTGGGIGAFLAKQMVGKAALRNIAARGAPVRGLTANGASKFTPKDIAARFFRANPSSAGLKGAAAGTFTAFLPINTGEIIQEQRDAFEGVGSPGRNSTAPIGAPELGPSLVLGAASSALEVLGFGLVGKAIFGAAKKEVVDSMLNVVLRRIGHASLKSLAAEGGTEAVQEAIVIASRKINDPTFSITNAISSSEGLSRIAFAGVSGAIVGGVLGGGGGVATGIRDAAIVGAQRADLRTKTEPGKKAAKDTFKENESGKVESLFDFDLAMKDMTARAKKVTDAVAVFAASVKMKLAGKDQKVAAAAATTQRDRVLTTLETEEDALDQADIQLRDNRVSIASAFGALRERLAQIPIAAELTDAQNKVVRKVREEIKVLLKELKAAAADKRSTLIEPAMAKIEALISKGMLDPTSIPVSRIVALLNAAAKAANVGLNNKATELKKARKVIKILRGRVNEAVKKVPEVITDEAAFDAEGRAAIEERLEPTEAESENLDELRANNQGTTTPVAETLRSIAAVVKGTKKFVFVVGTTIGKLPAAIKTAIGKGNLSVRQDGDRVLIATKDNIDKDAVAESFATDSATVDDSAVVVTTRDEQGGVVQNEVIPSDPVSASEAVQRGESIGTTAEVRTPDEAATESVSELVAEAEQTVSHRIKTESDMLSQVYRAVTAWLKQNPDGDVTRLPAALPVLIGEDGFPILWHEFQAAYSDSEHLAGLLLDMSNKFADPDKFASTATTETASAVADLEETIQLIHDGGLDPNELFNLVSSVQEAPTQEYLLAGNSDIVPAELNQDGELVREDGKVNVEATKTTKKFVAIKKLLTKTEALRILRFKKVRAKILAITGKKVEVLLAEERIQIVPFGDQFAIRVILPEGRVQAADRQVRKALSRGNDSSNKGKGGQYVASATKNGKKVWFHLGEVTKLGQILSQHGSSVFDRMANAHQNFLAGLAILETDYGYDVNFNPDASLDKALAIKGLGKKAIRKRAAALRKAKGNAVVDQNKIIYGQVSFVKSKGSQKTMWNLRRILKETAAGQAGVVAAIEAKIEATKKNPDIAGTELTWNEVSDWLLSEAKKGDMDSTDVSAVLFGQGFADPELIKALRVDNIEAEEAETEITMLKNESEFDDTKRDTSTQQFAPGLKSKPQVTNFIADWAQASRATQFILRMLNIKENVILFDVASADALIAKYDSMASFYFKRGEEITGRIYQSYAMRINKAKGEAPTGRILYPNTDFQGGTQSGSEHRVTHIFIRNDTKAGAKRNLVLGHELGHLVQRTHLDRLSPKLRKLVLKSLGVDSFLNGQNVKGLTAKQKELEAFANWMAKAGAELAVGEIEAGKAANPADNELRSFFATTLRSLKKAWKGIKKILLPYPEGFRDFVNALQTHAEVQRGVRTKPIGPHATPSVLVTPLARQIFNELQAVDAGLYISESVSTNDSFANMDLEIEADAEGRAADSVFQSYVDNFKKWAETLKNRPQDAAKMLVYTADGELRSMGKFGVSLARKFHALPSSTDPSLTVFREIHQLGAPFFTALRAVLKSTPGSRIPIADMIFKRGPTEKTAGDRALNAEIMKALMLATPSNELSAELRPHVARVRKYLRSLHTWYTEEMGLKLGLRKDYYPLMLDSLKVENNRGAFIAALRKHGFTEEAAQKQRQKLTRDEDGGLNTGFQEEVSSDFLGPGFASKRRRADRNTQWTNALRADLIDAGFYQEDMATTLIAYTEMAVRRAVWQTRFQETDFSSKQLKRYEKAGLNIHSPIAELQLSVHEAQARGEITNWQADRINKDILPAYAGQLGLRTNSHIRKLSAGIIIYQNIRLLSLAVLSSFVDVGTLFARGGWNDHKSALSILLNKADRAEAMEMLEAIGAMRQGLTEHVLNDQALNTFMTGSAKRINDMFFRYNGMEGWTNLMRTMGLVSGREFMQRNARKARAGDKTAQRYLNELSVTVAEIEAWGDGHSTTNVNINAALNRYIDEAMIRPDPSIRPVWMSDPGYGIFAHLKGFLYGFHETFLRRVGREALMHQNLLPLITLGMLALPFAAVGYEIRKKITGSKQAPEGFDYFKEVVERSGLPGAFQLVIDMEQADEFGKPFGVSLGGPAVEQLYDFLTKDVSTIIPRAIPLVAQSPVLRDWVRDTLE